MLFGSIVVFGCLVLVYSIQLPEELQEYADDLHNICIQKSGITEADYAAYDIKNNPHDVKIQCYMSCLMLESKWMTPIGAIQYDYILENAHPEIKDLLEAAINKCRKVEDDSDLCKKASNFNSCMYEADPENWFLV
uniref:Odorant binding protein 21 n=1 Tax=Xylotrechus quadripes TaxID=554073 RepID=A0A346HGP3_9CUCU|nr:odorant binding protein 21 [Xylotrechus quadripes]